MGSDFFFLSEKLKIYNKKNGIAENIGFQDFKPPFPNRKKKARI